ncbi:MAGE-domain-containing protein [Phellopilus nigrolimitatus]|nr:MAGE-domain-containing protein [Phellopilus nigrolimitatus]
MARSVARANGRSQPRGTQRPSQSQPSQSQRRRRRDDDDVDEGEEQEAVGEDDGDEEAGGEDDGGDDGGGDDGDDVQSDLARKANALVRLALFNESRRVPLRRDEINKRILGEGTRAFNTVFGMAQKSLQTVFGMELVELMSRAEREREQNMNEEVQDDANATGLKKKAASSGSKSYILRSTLADVLIDVSALMDEEIYGEECPAEADDGDDDEAPAVYGSIISWSTADQLGGLGLLYVILSLILVNGHTLSDPVLKKHLKTLRLPLSATIEFAPHATHKSSSIEAYLITLIKQGFLDKVKVGPAGAPRATQGKRGRGNDNDDEGASYEWRWGARAYAEVGEKALARFVAEFMAERVLLGAAGGGGDDDDDETQRRIPDEEERERVLENMLKDITRAAGGRLSDVR